MKIIVDDKPLQQGNKSLNITMISVSISEVFITEIADGNHISIKLGIFQFWGLGIFFVLQFYENNCRIKCSYNIVCDGSNNANGGMGVSKQIGYYIKRLFSSYFVYVIIMVSNSIFSWQWIWNGLGVVLATLTNMN